MADIQQLVTLTIIANTEPIKKVEMAVKEATKATSVYHEELKKLQRDIAKTQLDIRKLNIDLNRDRSTLEMRENERISLINQQELKDLERAINIVNSLGNRQVPDALLVEISRRLDPDNIKNSFKQIVDQIKLLDKRITEYSLKDALERTNLEDFLGLGEWSPEQRKALIEKLDSVQEQIREIEANRQKTSEEMLPELDPLAYEILGKDKNIQELKKSIEEQEILLEDYQVFLESLIQDHIKLVNEMQEHGIELPEPELRIDILDSYPKDLQNKLKDFKDEYYGIEGALAMTGEASVNLAGDQTYLSDAMNGVMVSSVALRQNGIDPLTGNSKESSEAVIDLVSSFEDGAVVFGYTKDELLGLGSATAEAAEKTKDLDKNALKGVSDQAGKAEETLGTLNSTTGDLSVRSEELAASQDEVTRSVADGSAAMDNAGASAEQFSDTLEQVENSGGFFDGIKQGFIDFVDNVESNSELMADFFANTLTEMSQNFSDLFYNVLTGRFDNLKDLAKQAFEAILRAFLDMVSAIATRQIVISIAGALGVGTKGAKATDALGFGKSAVDLAGSAIGAGGTAASAIGSVGSSGITLGSDTLLFGSSAGSLGLAGETISTSGGLLSSISSAIPYIGAAIAVIATAIPIISGLLKKTPRLDIDFDSVKTEVGRRAALVEEFLDPEFFMENIGQVSVKRGGVGVGAGGSNQILELIRERIEETIEGIQDIIAKLPTDLFNQLNETLLNAEIDIDTVIAGERLLEFDAKGKKIGEKFQQFIEGELPAKFFAAIRESFFEPAFLALGVSAEGTEALIDKFMADMEAAGSREARAEVGAEFIATFSAFVDAFNIVSGNVNDSIGQTIQREEWEYRMAA